jgi:metal-responsive CopG/Arc/MetJ family transcriptional regulator
MAEQAKKRVERVLVMLDEDELRTLDTWRFDHRMPSRSAAIRELLRMGLGEIGSEEAAQGLKSERFGVLRGPNA